MIMTTSVPRVALAVILPIALAACATVAPRPSTDTAEVRGLLERFAAGLPTADLRGLVDADHGVFLWTQPGAYPRPTVRVRPGDAPPTMSGRYLPRTAELLRAGLAVMRVDAGESPPPTETGSSTWASLDRRTRLTANEMPALAEEAEARAAAEALPPVYELRVQRGPEILRVLVARSHGRLVVTHVIVHRAFDA